MTTREQSVAMDTHDPLRGYRDQFQIDDGLIYLDGNSLGALPRVVADVMRDAVVEEWGRGLVGSWNEHDWIGLPMQLGDKIAPLVGADLGQVIVADSMSVNLYKLLAMALDLQAGRRSILSAAGNFPTDLYVAQGLARQLGPDRCELRTVPSDRVVERVDDDTAVVMLTHVDFRSGSMLDMAAVTRAVQARGALMLWDLAHSAGAMPLTLDACGVDMAVGCGYKYFNGGPGAPAFLYVAKRHHESAHQPLSGWMGHASPFDFVPQYERAPGVRGFLSGTPPVLSFKALAAALELFQGVDLEAIREKSIRLGQLFIEQVEARPELCELVLSSPRDALQRGSQVSFAHRDGYAMMQAMIDRRVVGDFREPDLLRFGLTPLYTRYVDVWDAVERLGKVVGERLFDDDRYRTRRRVT